MIAEYEIVTQVEFRHRYFLDHKLACFSIKPDLKTGRFLSSSGLVFKAFNGGFKLFFKSLNNQEKIKRNDILDDFVLRFHIKLNDSYFFNYTDCGAIK